MSVKSKTKPAGSSKGRGGPRRSNTHTTSSNNQKQTGACKALGFHVFDYGPKDAADQMANTWEQIIIHTGTTLGEDIRNELRNRKKVNLTKPGLPPTAVATHEAEVKLYKLQKEKMITAKEAAITTLDTAILNTKDPIDTAKLTIQKAELENDIAQLQHDLDNPPKIKLEGEEKAEYDAEWKAYSTRNSKLTEHRGQAFSLIFGQCTQVLKDKMKQDSDYNTTMQQCDPLALMDLIEKTVLSQSDSQYSYMTFYEQERNLLSLSQGSLTDHQYYEKFNTRWDVAKAVGVTKTNSGALEPTAQELYNQPYDALNKDQQSRVIDEVEERYLAFIFIQQSSHHKLKSALKDDFAKGQDNFPKNRQAALHLLDKYSKSQPALTTSEGSSFNTTHSQASKKGAKRTISFDPNKWKDRTCRHCGEKGHPHYIHSSSKQQDQKSKKRSNKKPSKNSPTSSRKSNTSKSKSSSTSKSRSKGIDELKKGMSQAFTSFAEKLDSLNQEKEDDSDLTDSDDDSDPEFSGCTLHSEIAGVDPFKTSHNFATLTSKQGEPDLKNVLLLDNQSTIDILCNKDFVTDIVEADKPIKVLSTGGHITVHQKATLPGYKKPVWFSKHAATNILSMKNVRKLHHISYDCKRGTYTVHRKHHPNWEFQMNDKGLHVHVPAATPGVRSKNKKTGGPSNFTRIKCQVATAVLELCNEILDIKKSRKKSGNN